MVTVEEAVVGLVPNVAVMPAGQFDAENSTTEWKPFVGVTVTVDVPGDTAVALAAVALNVKLGCAVTVIGMVVLVDKAPLVPVTVSVYGPGATLAATLIRTVDEDVAGLVRNVPVMPAGQPDAASVTPELKPLLGVTVTTEENDAAEFRGN
jgi:hypothetical protein